MALVANARMYAVAPAAAAAWDALFHRVSAMADVPLAVVAHPFPLPVSDLWKRRDLALAFMCGWPWVRGLAEVARAYDVVPVAAPLPLGAPGPRYWTDVVVHADNPARSLAALDGARVGYTLLDSQSGFSALRHHLLSMEAAPRFAAVVGPLTTPRRVLEAVADGRVDVAPVDSFAHALLRLHEPALAAQSRVLARTEPTPVPMLVASAGTDPAAVSRLRDALLAVRDPALLAPLALAGFAAPLPEAEYAVMERRAREAEAAGVHGLGHFLQARHTA